MNKISNGDGFCTKDAVDVRLSSLDIILHDQRGNGKYIALSVKFIVNFHSFLSIRMSVDGLH